MLRAVALQDFPSECFEVVVIADGCTDGTIELLEAIGSEMPYRLRWVLQEQSGPAAARNRAIQLAQGDLIVFLDDDVVPMSNWLSAHVARHLLDTRAVVIGPLSPGSRHRPTWVRWEDERLQQQYRAMLAGIFKPTPRQFYTGNSSVRRCWLEEVGGFDKRLRRGEDVELAFRLQDLGLRFHFEPRADGLHDSFRTYQSWRRIPRQYGQNDAVTGHERGRARTWQSIGREFHLRRKPTQWLARLCLGRSLLSNVVLFILGVAVRIGDRLRLHRLAGAACSGVWNLAYWQGLVDGVGGSASFWRLVDETSRTGRGTRQLVTPSLPSPDKEPKSGYQG